MTVDCEDADTGAPQDTTRYRGEPDESPSMAVVRAVATATDRDPVEHDARGDPLDPLAASVDPDALDRLVGGRRGPSGTDAVVEFRYCGRLVTVRCSEPVQVTVR